MAVRSKGDAEQLRRLARALYFSNETIEWFLASSSAAQLRAVSDLIGYEMDVRERNKRSRLYRRAKFPQVKSFDGYDFSQVAFPDGYGVDDLKSLSFVDAAQDFVFHGQTGRGKTHLAIAIGSACVMAGKAVRFYTAAELALSLAKAKREHRLEAMMKDIERNDLVTNPNRPTRRRLWSRGCDGFASSRSCPASLTAFGAGSRCRLQPRSAARGAGPRRSSLLSRRKNKITCRNAPAR